MNDFWQLVVTWAVVAVSAAYLAHGAWKVMRGRRGGCTACPACTTEKQSGPGQFVDVDELTESAKTAPPSRPTFPAT